MNIVRQSSYFRKRMVDLPFSFEGKNRLHTQNLFFSEGTYQAELLQGKDFFWPFLQIDDSGKILDCFCTCSEAEQKGHCVHLETLLKIVGTPPLHVRFHRSLWYELCQIAARRHGYESKVVHKSPNDLYQARSSTGKVLLQMTPLTKEAKLKLEEILAHATPETEETSLKFSKLSAEELLLWKQGRPSRQLQFELSFWSDLAKWWMLLQEQKKKYKIHFITEKGELPKGISIDFEDIKVVFYIAEVNWNTVIPTLQTVDSPLKVYELPDKRIQAITYDKEKKAFYIQHEALYEKTKPAEEGIRVGDYIYKEGDGFALADPDPILFESTIPEKKISLFLQRHRNLIEKYLKGDALHDQAIIPEYKIEFTSNKGLEISAYLFTPGDLQAPGSAYFPSWAYIEGKGFYIIENLHFSSAHFIVPKEDIADFVDKHRFWLQRFEGFQIHLSSVETKLSYTVSDRGLYFGTVLDVAEETSDMIDLGRLIYLKGRGFYAKSSTRVDRIATGTFVLPENISTFIRHHREELETVPGFFTSVCPIIQAGLSIYLNKQNRIVVTPEYTYSSEPVKIFGDYTFVEKQGFCEIPIAHRLPDLYRSEIIISPDFEPYFLGYELDTLQPFILSIDSRLKKPENLVLKVNEVKKEGKSSWLLSMDYESDLGFCSIFDTWRAFNNNERYLFSNSGLLSLKQSRFHWLKGIPKKRFVRKEKELRLSTLEWIRLSAFEPMIFAKNGKSSSEKLEDYLSFSTPELPILGDLKSRLRPYQEKGLQWLWFLYCNGLSGMLCDEMGLGKTHQAMSLVAAARAERKEAGETIKVLVVCPTSVMYHWQDLLKRFMPGVNAVLFHGAQRNLPENYELLLTSYGILRSEQKFFSELSFDLAIFDEMQIAKNSKSQTHKALRSIQAGMRLGLTGTPIENALIELKALFDVVLPGYMPNEAIFKELFVNPVEKKQDEEKRALLGKLIKPFILRRKKTEVLLELPDKIEQISYCYLSDEQRKMYQDMIASSRDMLVKQLREDGTPVPYMHIFALLTSLKRICDHPCLVNKNSKDYEKHTSGKWDLFIELLKEARESGQKVVVFSQYLDMLDIIEMYLRKEQIGFAGIRGSTRDRMEQLTRFRDDPACEVFVASLQAAGVGIDLVSASIVIHYDRWWNPARENQATDRVHRMGQNRGVQVFKMVAKDTIEEGIHRIIERKQGLLESVIGYDDHDQIKGMTRQELIEVLQMSGPIL